MIVNAHLTRGMTDISKAFSIAFNSIEVEEEEEEEEEVEVEVER